VQAAGNIGVVSCGGPVVQTVSQAVVPRRRPLASITDCVIQVIGRKDASSAAPDGTLPQAFGKGSDHSSLVQLWADKGFSQRELAALMGAHSVSRAFRQQQNGIPIGGKAARTSLPNHSRRCDANNLSRTARRLSQKVGHEVLRANPSQDRTSRRLQIRLGRGPRQRKHHIRPSVHRIRQRCRRVGHGFPVIDVQAEHSRPSSRHDKEPARLHWHRGLRRLPHQGWWQNVLFTVLSICIGAVLHFHFSYVRVRPFLACQRMEIANFT
jgi:hypothetical protein